MSLSLSLSVEKTDGGDVQFIPRLHNDGNSAISFTTGSATVFRITAKDKEGNHINGLSMASTQAVETWTVQPNEELSRTILWESKETWRRLHEKMDNLDKFNPEEMWEDFPEDYDEIVVTVNTETNNEEVGPLSLTKEIEIP